MKVKISVSAEVGDAQEILHLCSTPNVRAAEMWKSAYGVVTTTLMVADGAPPFGLPVSVTE